MGEIHTPNDAAFAKLVAGRVQNACNATWTDSNITVSSVQLTIMLVHA